MWIKLELFLVQILVLVAITVMKFYSAEEGNG